ncbi:hypothetical protein [Xanthomonas sp. WHRI 7945]|nr:hypothetical protein [Xanthomonas campestris pv. campestris]
MHWVDPDFLPETRGTLARFLLNPKAEVDGLLLDDGTEVHTAPHLSAQLLKTLKPGAALGVRGLKPYGADMLVALAIDPDGGKRIADRGPHGPHAEHTPARKPEKPEKPAKTRHSGVVARLLHGPHGQVHGALLDDDCIVRFPPHAADALANWLAVGQPLAVEGHALVLPHGTVIHAQAVGATPAALQPIAPKPHPPKPHDADKPKPKPKPKPKSKH